MNASERRAEWLRYLKICELQPNGLLAILEQDGAQMLQEVLKELKVKTAMDLVNWLKENERK